MVALESIPMRLPSFIAFWTRLLDCEVEELKEPSNEFMNLMLKNCTNFRDYITQILSQERAFLLQEEVFRFFKKLAPKVCVFPNNLLLTLTYFRLVFRLKHVL